MGTTAGKIALDTILKVVQRQGINVELPLQVGAHLLFHLIDLPKSKHCLPHDTSQFVRIGVVAKNL
jgi:hypothetical protein